MNPRNYSVVRDPVHGDIYLSRDEMRLLDTPEMQRLRGVRQLGTAYLVFPGAQHTRFEHSLGTLHLTAQLIDAVNLNHSLAPGELAAIGEDEARILRAAALVHDIPHIPFGHNIEDQSGILERHDTPARYRRLLSTDTGVGQILEQWGILNQVLAILLPASEPGLPSVPESWRELLSDTICPDILDYLKRDAYYTGLNLLYDDRVVNYFKIDGPSGHLFVDVAKRGVVREDILSEMVRILEARYFFSERVYYHHAKIAAGAMIAQAVENALLGRSLEPTQLQDQTDESLLLLLESSLPEEPRLRERQQELLSRYRSRRLLKRACVFPRYANRESQDPLIARFFSPGAHQARVEFEHHVEGEVQRRLGRSPLVTLYCPARRMQLKEAQTHVRFPQQDQVRPLAEFQEHLPRLADLSESYRNLWKLYVLAASDDREELSAVAEVAEASLSGAVNVYRPDSR